MSTDKLELKHLACYLPYGLQCLGWYDGLKLNKEMDIHMLTNLVAGDTIYKPQVRPLSDLAKKITHNGETFVPIERLRFIYNSCNSHVLQEVNFYHTDIDGFCLFGIDSNGLDTSMGLSYYEMVTSWHFDIHELIGKNLALPISNE